MKKQPLVSVIIPSYNSGKFLSEAIESATKQSYENLEIIIINDGSIDSTEEIIKEWWKKDKRIKYFKHNKNRGVSIARNTGIKNSKGKYIALLDADDLWHNPKKLEKQVRFLEKHFDYVLVGSGVITINKGGKELFRYYKLKADREIRKTILFKCPFAHSSVLFFKKESRKVGLYREDMHVVEDWEFWMRLGRVGKFYNFSEYFIKHRVHQESVSAQHFNFLLKEGIKIIKAYKNDYPNYFKALIYNYGKLFFFSLPFSQTFFRKFLSIRDNGR